MLSNEILNLMYRLVYKFVNLFEPPQVVQYIWTHSDILGFSFE